MGELAKDAIEKEATRFRLRQDFVCEYLGEPDDTDSLFGLALRLGWLNKVGVDGENPRKGVYAFFHPTFQEYFAALAIDDWHYFLNHIIENPSHPDASYRVFEPQWKEVFLLWLGQKHVFKEEKERFIDGLVKFEDRCNDFYWEQAVFIAAEGIAEFKRSAYELKIVEQLILWVFGYFDFQKQEWLEALSPLREEGKKALLKTNRSLVITQIIDFIQYFPDGLYARYRAIQFLGEIGSGYSEVIQVLSDLLRNSQDKRTIIQTATALAKIIPNHQEAIAILVNSLEDEQEFYIPESAAQSLGEIGFNSPEIVNQLVKLINKYSITEEQNYQLKAKNSDSVIGNIAFSELTKSERICGLVIQILGDIGVDNIEVINVFLKLITENKSGYICSKAIECLGKTSNINVLVIDILIKILRTSYDWKLCSIAAESLGKIGNGFQEAISALIYLMHNYRHYDNFHKASKSLMTIANYDNEFIEEIIDRLISVLQSDNHPYIVIDAVNCLGEIANGANISKTKEALVQLLYSNISDNTRYFVAQSLGKLDSNNRDAIYALEKILQNSEESYWQRCVSAIALEKIAPDNSKSLAILIDKILDTKENTEPRHINSKESFFGSSILNQPDEVKWMIDFLNVRKNIIQISEVVSRLRIILTNENREIDFARWEICYQILWFCSQNLSYQIFSEVWKEQK